MAVIIQYEPMDTFAEYMDRALYGAGGYYSSGTAKSGKSGDYFTAPDVGEAFGCLLAEIFWTWKDKLQTDSFTLAEAGAGEGRLAADILKCHPFHYRAVERSPFRLEALKKLPGIEGYPDLDSATPMDGILFANELIDAFPVHRVRMKNGALEEAYVCAPSSLRWGRPSTPRLQSYFDRLGITLPEDYETEVNLAMAEWLKQAGRALRKGILLLIDYGRPAHDYYAPERTAGTLRAFSKHKVSSSILEAGADLTADVDFTSLAMDARDAGFVPLAFMEMGTFLMMGVQGIVGAGHVPARNLDSTGSDSINMDIPFRAGTWPAPTGLKYLLHPEGMGGAFHVLILGKGVDPADWTFEHNRLRRLGLPE